MIFKHCTCKHKKFRTFYFKGEKLEGLQDFNLPGPADFYCVQYMDFLMLWKQLYFKYVWKFPDFSILDKGSELPMLASCNTG